MSNEKNQLLEAILQELKAITLELQLLRNELKTDVPPAMAGDNILTTPPIQFAEPSDESDESALAVHDWLATKGIAVRNYREQSAADTILDQVAVFLGERFERLSRVHDSIRRSLSTGSSFTLNLSGVSQAEIADTTQFCTMLKSYALLSSYKYDKHTKTIYAVPQRIGRVINFFTGGWFERFVYQRIHSLLSQNELEFTNLLNPQITLSNGDDFELDLLFLVDRLPLWVECKTGEYQAYIAKYSDARKILSVPKQRAILVILGIPNDVATNLTHLYDMTVVNENNFLEIIGSALGLPGYSPSQPPSQPTLSASGIPSSLQTLLNKAGLRPLPEYRQQVISQLILVTGSLTQPMTMAEVKTALAEKVPTSKSQLQDILNAVIRSGCLSDEAGTPVLSFTAPFSKLISDDPSIIESKCLESYVRAALDVNITYFDNPHHIDEFERIVGANAPDMATIKKLGEPSLV
jgi:hypothetical protein